MKKSITVALLMVLSMSIPARADQTMNLVDEYREGSGKVCVYSNGRNTATVYKSGAGSCSSKHTSR